jgi:nitroreductase
MRLNMVSDASSMSDYRPTSVLRSGTPEHEINPLIAGRHSSRAIDPDRPVPEALIRTLLEAARWAPSHSNEQPWAFAVATEDAPTILKQARRSLIETNAWARIAPALIFVLSRKKHSGAYWFMPNRLHLFETGMATAQMALQAASEGLVFHQMQGFYGWQIRRLFQVPRDYVVASAIAIGYPGNLADLPSYLQISETAQRVRHPQECFVFFNRPIGRP